MYAQHIPVDISVQIIVIPVNKSKAVIWFCPGGSVCVFVHVIIAFSIIGSDVHITPHHWFPTQSAADFQYTLAVFTDKKRTFSITVFPQIIAKTQHKGFIHTNVNVSGRKTVF